MSGGQARVAGRSDADALLAGVLATMTSLEALLERETGHLRVGRLKEGLAEEAAKAELTSGYLRGLEAVKANAVALARFAPDGLDRLKAAHQRLAGVVQVNQTVLATARAVSESLVKTLSDELGRSTRPQVYAAGGAMGGAMGARPAPAQPLLVSRNL